MLSVYEMMKEITILRRKVKLLEEGGGGSTHGIDDVLAIGQAITADRTIDATGHSLTYTADTHTFNGSVIQNKTYAQILTAIGASTLSSGITYKITDRGDRGLFFKATSDNELSRTGVRYMLCPATYQITTDGSGNSWIGVWNSTKSVSIGQLTIWGGLVWSNLTGLIGSSVDDFSLDGTNWAVISKASFSNNEYIELQFNVSYDVINDWIERQWDGNGNIFGIDFAVGGGDPNLCDVSDWNFGTFAEFYNNTAWGFYNNSNDGKVIRNRVNSLIADNSNGGRILDNIVGNNVYNNSNVGDIQDNYTHHSIENNSNTGNIFGNSAFRISNNSNNGDISYGVSNTDISSNVIAASVSNFSFTGAVNSTALSINDNAQTITYTADTHTFFGNVSIDKVLNLAVFTNSSPIDGDIWRADNTNTGLKIRINGVTKTINVS